MKRYKNIFFDLDNTLWDFKANSYQTLQEVFIELKINLRSVTFDSFFKIYSQINDYYWNLYRKNKVTKEILTTKRFEESLRKCGIACSIPGQKIHEKFIELLPTKTLLTKDTLDTLPLLHQKYRLFIITNGFKETQYRKLQASGIAHFFEKIFISEEINAPKPSKKIFEYALKSVNAKKAESLMIGDSWETDILGAQNAGIDQIYYCLPSSSVSVFNLQKSPRTNTFIIYSIGELTKIL